MGNASSIKPQAEIQDLKSNNLEKPEDVKSTPKAKCPDSCVITTEHTKLITAQGNTSKATAAKAPEILPSKAPSSTQKQVTVNALQGNTSKATAAKAPEILPSKAPSTQKQVTVNAPQGNTSKATAAKAPEILPSKAPSSTQKQVAINALQGNTSKATDAKAPEILPSKAPYLSQKQVNVNAPQGNIPKVSDPKAPEVLPSTVASSSQKQDLPSKAPLLAPPDDKTLKNSAEAAETATFSLQSVPDENKKGLSKLTTRFSSSLDRFWTSAKNFKARLTNRKWSTVSASRLDRVESEGGLSTDSRIESSMFLNQHKLDGILAGYKKKLSVLLVFPKASKQYKVFCEAIEKTNFIQPSQATDSRGSVSYCKENIFDLIIIDATNEKLLDAKDLCRKLRAHNPGTIIIAVRQRNYFPWPWESSNERLSSFIAAGFNRDFLETHSVTACQDALACFEKDVDSMIQLRLLKSFFLALENVQETIEISNASHELQYVNKAFENHMGYSVEEAKGKHWYELMVSDRNPMDQPMKIKQQLDSSNQWEGFNYIKKKTGEQVTNTCHIIPLIEAGKVLQFIGIRKILDSKLPEVKVNIIDSPSSGSNQSGWPAVALSDAHTGSRRISSAAMRERMMSITATQSPHSFFSNQNLMTEVTAALANIKSHQCPQAVYQIIDRVIEIIRSGDRSTKAGSIFKEDDELITELLDGLMTSSIPTNVEEDLRGRRRSTYYPMSKSISRMATRHSDAGSITIATLPLAAAMQSSAGEIRRVLDSVFTWNFNVIRLEELTNKRPLLYVGLKVFQTFEVYSFLSTDSATFKNWLDVIEQNYNSYNPYHNSTHAADVLQAAASLCRREKLAEMFDDLDVVSTLIAAAIHDLDHPGKTNSFLINSGHKLAILYNDVSVLENHHTALAFRLTFKDNTVNIFQKVEKDDYRILRQQIIDMVLATDMTKHFDYLGRFNDTLRRPSVDLLPGNLGARVYPVEFRTVVKRMLIKCCDVSNPTRPIESCKIWAERIAEEYCRQTDEEKALGLQVVMPVFDRAKCNIPKTQLSFMNLFILSMMESWNEFCPVPDLMRNLESNFDYWQQMEPTTKEKVVRVVTN